jgi:hypothetical protein
MQTGPRTASHGSRGAAVRRRVLTRAVPVAVLTLPFGAGPAFADEAPAGGASAEELVISGIVATLFLVAMVTVVVARRLGRLAVLDRLGAVSERVSGLPGWAAVPLLVAGVSLIVAVFGFYWDVATHIDHGRDDGIFGNAAHWPILVGLVGLAVAGLLSVLLGTEERRSGSFEPRPGWHVSTGGGLLLLCGLIALAGFPIDDVWHRIFGQDVTLWSPPHIQMVAGASLCTVAMWMLFVEAERSRPDLRGSRRWYSQEVMLAGAVLIGMSTLQGEFDFGVPQFRLLYQPVLIAVAAGIALVPARLRLGRGGALAAVAFFLVLRGSITFFVTGVFDHLTFHLPLYLGAAVVVELVANRVPTDRQLTFGAVSGLGIGTVGMAVEAAWSHVWMPVPWTSALLPEAAFVVVPTAVAAGIVGGFLARALSRPDESRQSVPTALAPVAAVVIVGALAYPLPTTGVDATANISLTPVEADGGEHAHVTIAVDPPDVAEGAEWFNVIAWQGAEWWTEEHTRLVDLEPVGDGVYETTEPVPIDGEWKAMVRLHEGRVLAATPIYLPEDRAIPAEEVPAEPETTRDFVPDEEILLREMRPTPTWVGGLAYTLMGLIALGWVGAFAAGARHLRLTSASTSTERVPGPPTRV